MRKRIAFDVGACLGESICRFDEFDEIYAFEPAEYTYDILTNTQKEDKRVKCFKIAISDQNGSKLFYYHDHYGYSSFFELDEEGEFFKKCQEDDPGFNDIISKFEVETKRLDTFMKENHIDHIDFLKIDTQGNDLNVIKSLGNMIDCVDTIELEVQIKSLYKGVPTKDDIVKYMYDHNFTISEQNKNGDGLDNYEQVLVFKRKKEMSIPVIGVAVVTNPYWVTRLLMSIDYPVDNFVIINNNGKGEIDEELNNLTRIKHKFVKNIKVTHLPANIGCSGAWNLIIKSYILSPYWIIVSDDVAFGPGFLKEMIESAENDSEVGMVHGHSGDFNVGSWDLFLIKDFVIRKYGLFDENLYPAYCEDADYIMRFIHDPLKRIMSLKSNYYHGMGDKTQYYEHGSQTKKSIPELETKLSFSNETNFTYLNKKWGTGWRTCEPTQLPFNNYPISYTSYDLDFVRSKHLGF